jgi:hypothetical protein
MSPRTRGPSGTIEFTHPTGSVDSASLRVAVATHPPFVANMGAVRCFFRWPGGRARGSVPEDAGIPGNVHGALLERGEGDDLERPFVGGGQHHVGGRAVLVGA